MEIRLQGGVRGGEIVDIEGHLDCVEICYVDNPEAVTVNPNDAMPQQRVLTQKYRRTDKRGDDGRVVFRHLLFDV